MALGLLLPELDGAPAPVVKRPRLEVLFCIDTTGSMSGLLDGAKAKIWTILNQIASGKPHPEISVSLVAFRDRGDSYITKVHPMTTDFDQFYLDLKALDANEGGDTPESVNQALDDSVNKVKWSESKQVIKLLFLIGDAPPHMDYPDDVKYPVTCKKAKEKGIIINTIQCGDDNECTRYWKEIAEQGGGAFTRIPQTGGTRSISTPHDKRLAEINAALLKSVLVFGDAARKDEGRRKAESARTMPQEAAAERASFAAKEGRVAVYDLLDNIRLGKVKLTSLKDEELPEEIRRLDARERGDFLDRVAGERSKLLREAADLDRARMSAIAKELEKNRDSFDAQVMELIRKQTKGRIRY
jgi:Mg-chelatase subunit ChlD